MFFQRFLPLVQNATSLSEAALILNKEIWSIWGIAFKSNQTPDIMSPFQVCRQLPQLSCIALSFARVCIPIYHGAEGKIAVDPVRCRSSKQVMPHAQA